ncbi:hypothetical protein H6F97_27300 [Microcoleus sp. FACHB-1]|nr:hypothetical protein [Microcoleus sp. FACHB-1]
MMKCFTALQNTLRQRTQTDGGSRCNPGTEFHRETENYWLWLLEIEPLISSLAFEPKIMPLGTPFAKYLSPTEFD